MSDNLTKAAQNLENAIAIPGSHPDYHYYQRGRLIDEWPVLWEAIQDVRAALKEQNRRG